MKTGGDDSLLNNLAAHQMNALASAQLALKVGLPSVGLRLSRAPTVSEMFRQLQTVQRGSGAMFGDLEKSSRARRGQRSPGVVFAKGARKVFALRSCGTF